MASAWKLHQVSTALPDWWARRGAVRVWRQPAQTVRARGWGGVSHSQYTLVWWHVCLAGSSQQTLCLLATGMLEGIIIIIIAIIRIEGVASTTSVLCGLLVAGHVVSSKEYERSTC